MMEVSGKIFAIKRYAIHDGPHIRTTVFFKGCPLHCRWCHNPEGIDEEIQVVTVPERCIGCGLCIEECPTGALSMATHGICRDSATCSHCGACVGVCPSLAHDTTGWEVGPAELFGEIQKDIPFYDQSGGGVTFSGGEPLMQARFLLEMLKMCGQMGIHRTVDTCGFTPVALLLDVAEETDLFLYDIKHMDGDIHRQLTGTDNRLILSNVRRLAEAGNAMQIRIPLIPGVNDDEQNIRRTGEFVATLPGVDGIDVLPYHRMATAKYRKLSKTYVYADLAAHSVEEVQRAAFVLENCGLNARIGG